MLKVKQRNPEKPDLEVENHRFFAYKYIMKTPSIQLKEVPNKAFLLELYKAACGKMNQGQPRKRDYESI